MSSKSVRGRATALLDDYDDMADWLDDRDHCTACGLHWTDCQC
ncbi:Uncharacterised protein [Mycobacteroides abscessus subsp. abscessus]|nr:Uncharacterised protein [Mycobacteroides abscessus subsp. abscessus]